MALIQCPECIRDISEKAVACPFCGFPMAAHLNQIRIEQQDALNKEQCKLLKDEQLVQKTETIKETTPEQHEAPLEHKHSETVHKHGVHHKPRHQDAVRKHLHHNRHHEETLKGVVQKKAEKLEEEYACLKILFTILGTEEFRDIDYKSISYLDDTNENELVILSDKYKVCLLYTSPSPRD